MTPPVGEATKQKTHRLSLKTLPLLFTKTKGSDKSRDGSRLRSVPGVEPGVPDTPALVFPPLTRWLDNHLHNPVSVPERLWEGAPLTGLPGQGHGSTGARREVQRSEGKNKGTSQGAAWSQLAAHISRTRRGPSLSRACPLTRTLFLPRLWQLLVS